MRNGNVVFCKEALLDVSRMVPEVCRVLGEVKQARTASMNGLNLYIDPRLAGSFNVNLHLMQQNDMERESGPAKKDGVASSQQIQAMGKPTARHDVLEDENGDVVEKSILFPSKRARDPNYLCFMVMQRAEGKLYVVSAYMMETYLGQYVHRSSFFFRDGSKKAARACFRRVVDKVRDLKKDYVDGSRLQSELPYLLRRTLKDETGEIEPKINGLANYLNPANAPSQDTLGSENILYIPTNHDVDDDLERTARG